MQELLKKLAVKAGELVTVASGIAIMMGLVWLSSLVGIDFVAIVGGEEKVFTYAASIGAVAGYGILQWVKTLPIFTKNFTKDKPLGSE